MTEVLVGTKEVAALLGVSRQRVNRIAQTHSGFPRPVGRLAAGRVWKRKDILEWATKRGQRPNLNTANR